MSIYPVKLSEWYSTSDAERFEICFELVSLSRCFACGRRLKWKKVMAHHSIPFGHGDMWCSKKCLESAKEYKLDKRQKRKVNRKRKEYIRHMS